MANQRIEMLSGQRNSNPSYANLSGDNKANGGWPVINGTISNSSLNYTADLPNYEEPNSNCFIIQNITMTSTQQNLNVEYCEMWQYDKDGKLKEYDVDNFGLALAGIVTPNSNISIVGEYWLSDTKPLNMVKNRVPQAHGLASKYGHEALPDKSEYLTRYFKFSWSAGDVNGDRQYAKENTVEGGINIKP